MSWLALYLFVSTTNNATKQPDNMSDIGQLVSQYSCDMLQTTPTSQICAIETIIFLFVQVVGGIILIFEVHQCTFSILLHALQSRFSHRAEEFFSDPTLDMRNARTNRSKEQRRSMLLVHLKLSYNTTNHKTIEILIFEQCVFAMAEIFVTYNKSTRLPIELCHLAVLPYC